MLEERIHPLIASTGISMENWTTKNLCLQTNFSSIKHVVAPELRSGNESIEIDLKWMLAGKEKSSIEVVELWEQHEFGLSNHMALTVVGHCRFPVVGAIEHFLWPVQLRKK
jgi:hypothetical protein